MRGGPSDRGGPSTRSIEQLNSKVESGEKQRPNKRERRVRVSQFVGLKNKAAAGADEEILSG